MLVGPKLPSKQSSLVVLDMGPFAGVLSPSYTLPHPYHIHAYTHTTNWHFPFCLFVLFPQACAEAKPVASTPSPLYSGSLPARPPPP